MTDRRPAEAAGLTTLDELLRTVREIVESETVERACLQLCRSAVRHLGADVACVSRQGRRGAPELLAATDPVLADLVAARAASAGAGPGPPGAGEHVLLSDLGSHPLTRAWRRDGLCSALLIGLPPLEGGAVTLELYTRDQDVPPWSVELAVRVAGVAGLALRELGRRTNLQEAMSTRDVIGQAQGVLMERFGLTSEQAISYLRRHSQQTHRPVRSLATQIVADTSISDESGGQDA